VSRLQLGQLEFTANGTPFVVQQGEEGACVALLTANSQQIFLAHNGLPACWRGKDRYVILETGFGFGLNFLNTWRAWCDDPARCRRLHFLAFSAHPLSAVDLGRSLALWPELAALSSELCQHWPLPTPGMHRLHLADGQVTLTLVFGDPASQLRAINASVNAFILNGFSPERSPD
jgi:tRNA 5-methylaminomethyl-2-thiouridine biosynthesis bifunctional protein